MKEFFYVNGIFQYESSDTKERSAHFSGIICVPLLAKDTMGIIEDEFGIATLFDIGMTLGEDGLRNISFKKKYSLSQESTEKPFRYSLDKHEETSVLNTFIGHYQDHLKTQREVCSVILGVSEEFGTKLWKYFLSRLNSRI